VIKIGDLVRLTTPDSDDGKLGLVHYRIFDHFGDGLACKTESRATAGDEVISYGVQILGEELTSDFLSFEVTTI